MLRQTERFVGAERTHFQRLNGQFQIVNRTGWRRKMPDVINRTIKEEELRNVLMDESEITVTGQMRDVIDIASDKIIYGNDLVVPLQKQFHQIGTQEPDPARDHRGWTISPGFSSFRTGHINE